MYVLAALFALGKFGLNFGIDFTGGSLLEATYASSTPAVTDIAAAIQKAGIDAHPQVEPSATSSVIIRTQSLTQTQHDALLKTLSFGGTKHVTENSFNDIGPTIGQELRSKAWIAILIVVLAITAFVAYVFRGVSEPIRSWNYGVITIVALFHDVLMPAGIFAALGYQVDSLFVIALLATLGLSVNDTIVVFDRIRENLRLKVSKDFAETVGKSLRQTVGRSINTSLTIMIVLIALYMIGPASTQHFALAMALGLFFGTYSSIFLASPLLVVLERRNHRK